MTLLDIANSRLHSQHITKEKFKTAADIVSWMGAMQAQDYDMSKWALGVRLPSSTEEDIEKAIDSGKIIRTHVLRPTWHLVSADSIYWMLELTAPRIKSTMASRDRELELTDTLLKKSNVLLEKALIGNKHLTREELVAKLNQASIPTNDNRASHILLHAELDGIICSGASKDKKQTYALLQERVSQPKQITKEEALGRLAKTYFSSHGFATLQDFVWWSGLSVGDAKKAMEMIKSDFIQVQVEGDVYWVVNSFAESKKNSSSVYLLPAFDEFIISYKNRTAYISIEHQKKAFTSNGIFKPVIVVNGKVTGIWKRTIKTENVLIEMEFFGPHNELTIQAIEEKAGQFGSYLKKQVEVIHK